MNNFEFDLLSVPDAVSSLDGMTPPTLDDWTVALEILKFKERNNGKLVLMRGPDTVLKLVRGDVANRLLQYRGFKVF